MFPISVTLFHASWIIVCLRFVELWAFIMKYKGVRNYLLSKGLLSTTHTPLCARAGAAGSDWNKL